jgi:hypothetical protein
MIKRMYFDTIENATGEKKTRYTMVVGNQQWEEHIEMNAEQWQDIITHIQKKTTAHVSKAFPMPSLFRITYDFQPK